MPVIPLLCMYESKTCFNVSLSVICPCLFVNRPILFSFAYCSRSRFLIPSIVCIRSNSPFIISAYASTASAIPPDPFNLAIEPKSAYLFISDLLVPKPSICAFAIAFVMSTLLNGVLAANSCACLNFCKALPDLPNIASIYILLFCTLIPASIMLFVALTADCTLSHVTVIFFKLLTILLVILSEDLPISLNDLLHLSLNILLDLLLSDVNFLSAPPAPFILFLKRFIVIEKPSSIRKVPPYKLLMIHLLFFFDEWI